MKFAKLFEFENEEQVLLTNIYNDEQNTYDVSIRTDCDGAIAQITMSFSNIKKANQSIENYTEEDAIHFRQTMSSMFE